MFFAALISLSCDMPHNAQDHSLIPRSAQGQDYHPCLWADSRSLPLQYCLGVEITTKYAGVFCWMYLPAVMASRLIFPATHWSPEWQSAAPQLVFIRGQMGKAACALLYSVSCWHSAAWRSRLPLCRSRRSLWSESSPARRRSHRLPALWRPRWHLRLRQLQSHAPSSRACGIPRTS